MRVLLAIALAGLDASAEPVDFDTQVMPVLTKSGCNTGACHGAAAGRGGFFLSLYGSRPGRDFDQITRALEGRRINSRRPEDSLFLLKPTEQLSHEGGTRIAYESDDHHLLLRWIREGARRIDNRRLTDFALTSGTNTVAPGDTIRLQARATFSDGTTRDVLTHTVLTPSDPSSVVIDADGNATFHRSGRHLIVARYLDRVVPLEVLVPFTTVSADEDPSRPTAMEIDDFINRRLRQLGLKAAAGADDQSFVRRLSLDITGRLPAAAVVTAYANDSATDKRERLVDELLNSEAYVEFHAFRMAQLLRIRNMKSSVAAATGLYNWLQDAVRADRPWTDVAQQLLLGEGALVDNPPAGFYAVTSDPRAQAEFVSQALLGVRLQCANCHDHPLDSWTQDDYHGLAAIFAKVKRGQVIRVSMSGEVIHPATGEPAAARIPGSRFLPAGDNRQPLADWVTAADNQYLARAAVNRIWKHLMGRGLVEPVDDLRATNPATHPELFAWLCDEYVRGGYRMKPVIRAVCRSDAYARSRAKVERQPDVPEFYVSAVRKSLSPEVLLDAVADVTGVPGVIGAKTSRAVSVSGLLAESEPLDLLGRCLVAEDCEQSGVASDDLSVQLHLLNGELLNRRVLAADGRLAELIRQDVPVRGLVSEFYQLAYSRRATAREIQFWEKRLLHGTDQTTGWSRESTEVAQDFLWSVLNSDEFITNH